MRTSLISLESSKQNKFITFLSIRKYQNMTTGCLFGFIVFAPNSTIIYRFLTDDLREHIVQGMKKKGLSCEENPPEEEQVCRDSFLLFDIPLFEE